MKNTSKLLLAILIILAALAMAFTGCAPEDDGVLTDPPASSDITTEAETEPSAAEFYDIVSGGVCSYKIVYPADMPADSAAVKAAMNIRKSLERFTTSAPEIGDDWLGEGKTHDSEALEILVGHTSYPETAEVESDLTYGNYIIRAVGNKIVIVSHSDEGYTSAADRMASLFFGGANDNDDGTKSVRVSAEYLNKVFSGEKMASAIPVYDGGSSFLALDMSEGSYGIIIEDTTPDEYKKYLEVLTESGYKTHATNEIAGSYFTTVYTEEFTLNAGYYNNLDEARIIIEPYEDDTLAPLKSDAAPVTTSQITMLGVDGKYNGGYQNNGMCLIYRLSDGSFIVIDGGHVGNSAIYANNIIKELRAQSADYAKTDKDIRIACWIITHPHTDHHGTFLQEYKRFTAFTFDSIMCSFWNEEDFLESKNASSSFASGTWNGYLRSRDIAKEIGADFINPHVGQVYWYGDTAFEILYTIESYLPKVAAGFNTCSLVIRTTTTDTSGKSTTVMVTGDATGHAFEICNAMYGKSLASDIVQVAHHGAGTGGADKQTYDAYSYMKPSVIIWPAGTHNYADKAKKAWNQILTSHRNPNYKELYIAGWQGNAVTLPLPYTLGSAILNEVLEP